MGMRFLRFYFCAETANRLLVWCASCVAIPGADTSDERLPLAPALRNLDGEPTVAWRSPALPLLRGEGLIDVLEATGSALKLRPTLLMSSGTWNSIVLM